MDERTAAARREYKRQWVKKNPERIREYQRQWAKKNPDKVRTYQERYWTKKAAEQETQNARSAAPAIKEA